MAALTAQKVKLYKETYEFLERFNRDSTWRISLLNAVKKSGKKNYLGTPLIGYAWIIFKSSPQFAISHGFNLFDALRNRKFDKFAETLDDLFTSFWKSQSDREHLEGEIKKVEAGEIEHPDFISSEEHEQLNAIENLPESPNRQQAFEIFVGPKIEQFQTPHIPKPAGTLPAPAPGVSTKGLPEVHTGSDAEVASGEHLRGEESVVPPAEHLGGGQTIPTEHPRGEGSGILPAKHPGGGEKTPSFQLGSIFKPLRSIRIPTNISVSIKKFISRNITLTRLASVVTGGIGAIVGYGVTNTGLGAIAGGGFGISIPSLVKSRGAGQLVLSGFTKAGNAGGSFLSGISPGGGGRIGGGFSRITGGAGKKWALLLLLGFILLSAFLVGFAPAPGTPGGGSTATGSATLTGSGGEIAQCTFYRGGDRIQGLTFGNPATAALISDISGKVGVPAAIIAGILRIETATALASTDPTYLTNDYDAHCSGPVDQTKCQVSGIAFGTMQFTRPTFEGVYKNNRSEMQSLFGKIDFTTTLKPPEQKDPENVLRIYSVKDSIIASAFKVKADKQSINKDGPWDENTVKEIAARYYGRNADGTTNYPGVDGSIQNYGNDLWKSYSKCQPPVTPPTGTLASLSCPIPGQKIICASYGKQESWSGFDNVCAPGSNSTAGEVDIGGHCGPKYRARYPGLCSEPGQTGAYISGGNLKRTAKSIDIGGVVGSSVYIPTVNGQKLKWFFVSDFSDGVGATLRVFQSEQTSQGKWTIHFVHATADPFLRTGQEVDISQHVAKIDKASCPGCHIHVTVGLNIKEPVVDNNLQVYDPNWKFPDRELGMCR